LFREIVKLSKEISKDFHPSPGEAMMANRSSQSCFAINSV